MGNKRPKQKKNINMQLVTLNLTAKIVRKIDGWKSEGLIASRSEFIRQCVNDSLPKWEIINKLCNDSPTVIKNGRPPLGNNFYSGKVHETS